MHNAPHYTRAVRVGNHVVIAGTAATDAAGKTVGVGDVAAQTRRIFEIIEIALHEVGASLADVVRARFMLVNIEDAREALRVHAEIFGTIRAVGVVYEVSRFMNPEWLIEIEVDAIIDADGAA
jgi:enamine deaminase RidA (YjgF/YER057c/UK114 family)